MYRCPVCGYLGLSEPPRLSDGGGSYEICPSCWFEFGVSDDDEGFSYEAWRGRWIEQGLPWCSPSRVPPEGWDPNRQLRELLDEGANGSVG